MTGQSSRGYRNNQGAAAIMVALMLVMLIGFGALAVDIGYIAVVRNELQNAADAAALAGARVLFTEDGDVNTAANVEAYDIARKNLSEKVAVELDLGGGNDSDVQRGFWNLSSHVFTQSDSLDPRDINAVMVTTHKSAGTLFFARIFGHDTFPALAQAVAYRGYSSGIDVDFDQPITICQDKLEGQNGEYDCTKGRMIHSGAVNPGTGETGRWTNFSENCEDPANKPSVTARVCESTSVDHPNISTVEGEQSPAMVDLFNCWTNATGQKTSWYLVLPVIECVEPVVCSKIVGSVGVEVLWMTNPNGIDSQYNEIPQEMTDAQGNYWSQSSNCAGFDLGTREGRESCWEDFVNFYNLLYVDENGMEQPALYMPKALYFSPDCDYDEAGGPGGEDFNIKALYPKLVR